jgi:HEAT repeat protein
VHERDRLGDRLLRDSVEALRSTRCIEFMVASAQSRGELQSTLLADLASAHSERRRVRVVRTLGLLRSGNAYPAVWRSFYKDPAESVRVAALQFLAEHAPHDEFFRLLVDGLNDLQPRVRAESLRHLQDLPMPRVLPLLLPQLETEDEELARVLVDYVADLPSAALEEFLDAVLGTPLGMRARELLIRVLARTPHPGARELLETFLEEDEPRLRRAAVQQLTQLPGERARELVAACMQDPDPKVRQGALDAAAGMGATVGLPLLRAGLEDPAPELRRRALLHLARLRPQAALEDFRTKMRDPEPRVRAAALAALVLEGSEAVEEWLGARDLPALAEALHDLGSGDLLERRLAGSRVVTERFGSILRSACRSSPRGWRRSSSSGSPIRWRAAGCATPNRCKRRSRTSRRSGSDRRVPRSKTRPSIPIATSRNGRRRRPAAIACSPPEEDRRCSSESRSSSP